MRNSCCLSKRTYWTVTFHVDRACCGETLMENDLQSEYWALRCQVSHFAFDQDYDSIIHTIKLYFRYLITHCIILWQDIVLNAFHQCSTYTHGLFVDVWCGRYSQTNTFWRQKNANCIPITIQLWITNVHCTLAPLIPNNRHWCCNSQCCWLCFLSYVLYWMIVHRVHINNHWDKSTSVRHKGLSSL